jgi:uncharacterized protein YbaP (TraB family)
MALACGLLVGGFARAESTPEPAKVTQEKPNAAATARPYLWKIEATGQKPSWIFGTIHLQRPDVATLPPAVTQAAQQADAVYTEIPLDMATVLAMASKMMAPDQSLREVLGPKVFAELEAEIKSVNPELSAGPFERYKPWAVAAALIALEDQMKHAGSLPVDMVIFQRAAMAGKEVGGIETAEEQLAVFDAFTTAEQITMVSEAIRQIRAVRATGESASDLLARLYLKGDLDVLVTELLKMDAGAADPALSQKFLEKLLYDRNVRMAERMIKKLRNHPQRSYFFAVGAAHLQGERGLVAALEKAGFHLTRAQ